MHKQSKGIKHIDTYKKSIIKTTLRNSPKYNVDPRRPHTHTHSHQVKWFKWKRLTEDILNDLILNQCSDISRSVSIKSVDFYPSTYCCELLDTIWGWAEKFIGTTIMQWLILFQMWLNFQNSILFGLKHFFHWCYVRLDSRGLEALILILGKVLNCRYDLFISQILLPSQVFISCWGIEHRQMVPNQENMEDDQSIQRHSHAQQPL